MPTEEQSLVEGMLSNCEQEVRQLGGMLDARDQLLAMLRRQLADKERAIQRLLLIEDEQASRIRDLEAHLALVEAAASV